MRPRTRTLAQVLAVLLLTWLIASPAAAHERQRSADDEDASVAVDWFDLLYGVVKAERLSPPVAARTYGVTSVALYESIVPGTRHLRSLSRQLNDLQRMPKAQKEKSLDWPLVASSAAAHVVRGLLPTASPQSLAAIVELEQRILDERGATLTLDASRRSVEHGRRVAEAVLAWADSDGYTEFKGCAFTPPVGPGLWRPTPPGNVVNPVEPCWGRIRPFVLDSGLECAPPPPPAYSEVPGSLCRIDAEEVRDTVQSATTEQLAIASYWSDGPVQTGTPPGHWVSIAGQVLTGSDASLAAAAEAYARVGIAVADAFIACWDTKYFYNVLRPISYIRDVLGDAAWLSPIGTPPFPEYTSGHSVQSAAAAEVLTAQFGTIPFTDATHAVHNPALNLGTRSFSSFLHAAEEAGISRLYGGIHYRAAIELGIAQGQCIAGVIGTEIRFSKSTGGNQGQGHDSEGHSHDSDR